MIDKLRKIKENKAIKTISNILYVILCIVVVSMKTCVDKRNTIGAPGPDAMKEVIERNREYLNL